MSQTITPLNNHDSQASARSFPTIKNLYIPQRVLLSVFGFLAIVNAFLMRLCLDVAMTEMIFQKHTSNPPNTTVPLVNVKPLPRRPLRWNATRLMRASLNVTTNVLPVATSASAATLTTYNWSEQLQSIILSAFYVGYVIGHIPSSMLAEKYGGKWLLSVAILCTAVCTLLTPTAIKVGGPVALIVIRILIGLSESPTYPALSSLLSQWVPARERGKLGVLVLSGSQVGVFVVYIVSSFLLKKFQWPIVFYFFGCCALLWLLCFTLLCYNDPETHPYIREQEKNYLRMEIKDKIPRDELPPTPWKAIATNLPMWALTWATFQFDWNQYASALAAPKALHSAESLRGSIEDNFDTTMPYFLKWMISLVSGCLSDILVEHNVVTTTNIRKIMTSIAAFGPHILRGFASCLCERNGLVPFLQCSMGVVGTYYAGVKLTPLDMSPNYAGCIMGIANGIGSATALVAPYWNSWVQKNCPIIKELSGFLWVFCTALTSGDIQPFNDPNKISVQTSDEDKNK